MIIRKALCQFLPAALLIISAAIFTSAQSNKINTRPTQPSVAPPPAEELKPPVGSAKYFYEFNQPDFYIRHVKIEHDSLGRGHIVWERKNEDEPVKESLELSPAARNRILSHYEALRFIDSQTAYQSDKQFPHLGTVRLQVEQDTRKRSVEFNWSNNPDAAALANEYRKITDQAVFVFDISVARENQPLNAPKLMEGLETLLRRNGLSDPKQLVPLLKEISTDDHLPLIARNHALRLLKKIEK